MAKDKGIVRCTTDGADVKNILTFLISFRRRNIIPIIFEGFAFFRNNRNYSHYMFFIYFKSGSKWFYGYCN